MKKGIIAILAMLTVFAMVSCGGGGGGGGSSGGGGGNTKITFDLNYDTDDSGTAAGTFKEVKVNAGTMLGKSYPSAIPTRPDGALPYQFIEWNSEPEGTGNWINGNTKFARDTTVYAIWETYNSATQKKVTFNYNHDAAFPASIVRIVTIGNTVDSFPTDPGRSGYVFRGWFSDLGTADTQKRFTANTSVTADINVDVRWIAVGTKPALLADEVRFEYDNGTDWQDIVFEPGVTTWSIVKAQLVRGTDVYRDQTKAFANWAVEGTDWTSDSATIDTSATYKAKWRDGVVTGATGALEKVYLENGQFVVYEFTLTTPITDKSDLTDKIKAIKADYAVSEAGKALVGRPWRVLGPYFFDPSTPTEVTIGSDTHKFYGDFALANNGTAFIARMDGSNTKGPKDFNKFHAYMCYNGNSGFSAGAIASDGSKELTAEPAVNEWFTTTYTFDKTTAGGGLGGAYNWKNMTTLLDGVFTDGKDGTVQVLKATPFPASKIYFAIGVTRVAGKSDGKNGTQNPWEEGIISLVKNVKLVLNDDSEIDGVAPSLTTADGAATNVKQVFAAYINPVSFAWRGPVADPVVIIPDPGYTVPTVIPPALASYTIKNPTFTLYQSDEGKDTATDKTRKRITIDAATNKITFDLTDKDYNNGGDFGGGGFKIVFADIDLPEDYRSYKNIILDCTIKETATGTMFGNGTDADPLKNPRQLIFSSINGGNVTGVVNNTASGAEYVNLLDGDEAGKNVFRIPVGNLVMKNGEDVGLAVRTSNWNGGNSGADVVKDNVPLKGTLTVNRITFSIN